jgi:hypothetical protein
MSDKTEEDTMARLADAATLTAHLSTLTDELHREVTEGAGDLAAMVELADRISESADDLATALNGMNDALSAALSKHAGANGTAPTPTASAFVSTVVAPNGDRGWSFTRWAKSDVQKLTGGARRLFAPRRNAALVTR